MAIGGNIEQKDIGLEISANGTFNNTELTDDGKVRLKIIGTADDGKSVYAKKGDWTSQVINIGDNFKAFGKLLTVHTAEGTSSIQAYSRTSNNGTTFDGWEKVLADGTIQSEKRVYIQVRIEFTAGFIADSISFGSITKPTDVSLFSENKYIETNGDLRLKRNYEQDMTIDQSWTEEGSLHRVLIKRDEWARIDSLDVTSKE